MWARQRARPFSICTGTSKAVWAVGSTEANKEWRRRLCRRRSGNELDRGDRRRAEGCNARARHGASRHAAPDPQRAQELAEGAAAAAERGGGAAGAAARAEAARRGGRG